MTSSRTFVLTLPSPAFFLSAATSDSPRNTRIRRSGSPSVALRPGRFFSVSAATFSCLSPFAFAEDPFGFVCVGSFAVFMVDLLLD